MDCRIATKSWQKKLSWTSLLGMLIFIMAKHLRMSTFIMITSQGIVTKSVTDTTCWVRRQERGVVEAYYRSS